MSEKVIELVHLQKQFGENTVLRDINLSVEKGEVLSIIGASGSGKSTMLRCINQLETPTSGQVLYHGKDITGDDVNLSQYRAKVGMVFQSFNLFNNMSALKNCVTGQMSVLKRSREEAEAIAMKYLERVGMSPYINARPSQLSGGQKQRVAIARALASNPKVLLCDEATSALDPQTTQDILCLLQQLNRELGITVVVITHEMAVVKQICNRVAVMEEGRVVEQGEIFDVFSDPQQPITRRFIATTDGVARVQEQMNELIAPLGLKRGDLVVQFSFHGSSAGQALVSSLSRTYGIDISIIYGNVEMLDGKPLGKLITVFRGDPGNIDAALAHIDGEHVRAEVLHHAE